MLGSTTTGPLLEQPLTEVGAQIHNLGVAHWLAARALVPLMRDSADSSYIIISGTAGVHLPHNATPHCRLLCRRCDAHGF